MDLALSGSRPRSPRPWDKDPAITTLISVDRLPLRSREYSKLGRRNDVNSWCLNPSPCGPRQLQINGSRYLAEVRRIERQARTVVSLVERSLR